MRKQDGSSSSTMRTAMKPTHSSTSSCMKWNSLSKSKVWPPYGTFSTSGSCSIPAIDDIDSCVVLLWHGSDSFLGTILPPIISRSWLRTSASTTLTWNCFSTPYMLLLDGSQHPLVLDSTILSADGRCSWDLVLVWQCVSQLLLVQPQHTSTITKLLPLVEPASPSFLSSGSFLRSRTHPCSPYIPQKSSQVSKNSQPFRNGILKFPRRDAR